MDEDNEFLDEAKTFEESVSLTVPQFRKWDTSTFYDYEHQIADYEQLEELNKATTAARVALFKITDKINEVERLEKAAKIKYERKHRREYMKAHQKTEAGRKAYADLQCEELENNAIVYEQVKQELVRTSNSLRLELQTLQALGNNLRMQLKVE